LPFLRDKITRERSDIGKRQENRDNLAMHSLLGRTARALSNGELKLPNLLRGTGLKPPFLTNMVNYLAKMWRKRQVMDDRKKLDFMWVYHVFIGIAVAASLAIVWVAYGELAKLVKFLFKSIAKLL